MDDDENALDTYRSMETTPAFRVQAKLRNNRLIKAREELGYKTAVAAATALGLNYSSLVAYEGLKESPWTKKMGWKPMAEKIAASYGYACDELWPEVISRVTITRSDYEVSEHVLALAAPVDTHTNKQVLAAQVGKVLLTLSPREEEVVRRKMGLGVVGKRKAKYDHEETNTQIATALRISPSRVHQIERKALRLLRHPSRSKRLKTFVEGE